MKDGEPGIIYEDTALLVLEKPAGLIVNRADTTANVQVLQDWVEKYLGGQYLTSENRDSDFVARSGIVHRLDKETSGVIIVAKNEEVFKDLQRQFKERMVAKTYTALVHGRVVPKEGEINVPVGRIPWNRKKFGVVVQGKESKTLYMVVTYKVLREGKNLFDYSLVEAYPQTGRTHQIRVHFRYLGFPIAGDELYAGRRNLQRDRKYLGRHFLHASKIRFNHPIKNIQLEISSQLPAELVDFLDLLH